MYFRPQAAAFVAVNDTPLIVEPAVTRGRSAMDGGDERAGAKSVEATRALLSAVVPALVPQRTARGERRDQGRARSSMTHSPFVAHHPS
jgi:hypothetical protein